VTYGTEERLIDRLLNALAAQLDSSGNQELAGGALAAFTELNRDEAVRIFGQASHLVHYGSDTEPLQALIQNISAVQRGEAPADASLRPGDEVRLVGELPEGLADYDQTWVRETAFVVRYVDQDEGTLELQPHLSEDFVIETVPAAIVERSRQRNDADGIGS
jgi:hypothetical protein